eukprot:GFUD01037938.1.p1 GENE.GFUD01037938.1~~GFUD01037938.1.p1  ORF type:complete len:584 (+),score=168.40 GFUD01037938.1:71-1753(+)
MEKEVKKVKDEPMEEIEYSEVRDGPDLKANRKHDSEIDGFTAESTFNIKPEKNVAVKKEPSVKDNNDEVIIEPIINNEAIKSDEKQCTGPQNVPGPTEDCSKDLNDDSNSKASKDEAIQDKKETEAQKSLNYISDENFKRNMNHMFPSVHADIIKTFMREFCGLCGAHFDSEKRAWTHYFSSEHNHALKKRKKYAYPPFWKMIKLALADVKPAGASKKNIYDFVVKSYPGVKTLKETEIYDQLGKNLVEMVTKYQNVQIDDEGEYKLRNKGRVERGKSQKQNELPSRFFQSDKRYFIPDSSLGYGQPSPPLDYAHHGGYEIGYKEEHFGYRNFVAKSRGVYEDERVQGSRDRNYGGEREERMSRSRNRPRSRSTTNRREKSRHRSRSRSNRRERSRHISSSRSNRRERSSHRESTRLERKSKSRCSKTSRGRSSSRSSKNVKVEVKTSPHKFSQPIQCQPPRMQMPMLPMPMSGTLEGGGAPIIIIPSNLSSGGFPQELLAGNLGMPGMSIFPSNNFAAQFSSFQSNTPPGFSFPMSIPNAMFQVPQQVSVVPSPPLSPP